MGRRVRILLSVLTCMITCVTLVSLTVSLYHVHSIPTTILVSTSAQFQRESRSDFYRRRPPISVTQSARTVETPDHDPITPINSDSDSTSAWKETTSVIDGEAITATMKSSPTAQMQTSPGEKTKTVSSSLLLPRSTKQTETKTETDVLCSSCRYSPIGPNNKIPCIQRMLLKIKNSGMDSSSDGNTPTNKTMTLAEAGRNIAVRRPDYCGRCDPDQCSATDKHYWRFDAAAPTELVHHSSSSASAVSIPSIPASFSSRTHYLKSIGAEARLPVSALQNLTAFFANSQHIYPETDYLFEFNPSLVQIPASQIPTSTDLGGVGVGGNGGAVYLASFRVSNVHNCVIDPETMLRMVGGNWPRRKAQVKDFLGLALLRADLTIVADTVVDAKEIVHKMQDPRLFVLHDQIYVGSYHRMTPLWLVQPPVALFENNSHGVPGVVPSNATIQAPNLWKSHMTVFLRTFGSCTADREIQRKGKNLNYFVDAENKTMMEMFPAGPKEEIEVGVRCTKSAEGDPPGTFVFPNMSAVPLPSFGTVEELDLARERIFEPAITGDRGSYCCVPITVKGQRLLLGIAHSKTRYNHKQGTDAYSEGQIQANHFFSSFYAIQDRAPYNVVARSGKFCLGFAQDKDESDNPYTMMNVVPLQLMGKTFDCPRIHFVTGMVEKADDSSKVIISYGINDCVPRMVVMDKIEIIQILFNVQARLSPTEFATTSSR